jgi:lysophospholipase L1-like esterase
MGRRLLAGLIGLALGLGLAEGVARFVESRRTDGGPGAPLTFRPHALLSFELTPDVRRRGRETIGPIGFRGPTPAVPKPEGTTRVLCLGGSTTYGDGLEDGETFPEQLQARGGGRFEAVNCGVPGYTTAESLMDLCLKGLDLEPDVIVVHHGVNDYRPRTFPDLDASYRGFRRIWVEEELERTPLTHALGSLALGRLVLGRKTQRHGLYAYTDREVPRRLTREEVVATNSLFAFERNLRALVAVAQARGIGVIFATQPQSVSAMQGRGEIDPIEEHNEVTRLVAGESGAVLCDVARDFPEEGTYIPGDPVHLNAAGSGIQAERILAALVESGALERPAPRAAPPAAEPWAALEPLPSPLSEDEREALASARAFRPAPYFVYEPAPGPGGPATLGPHDANGFRGRDDGDPSADSGLRVAVVGGASAYGLGVGEADSTPRRLEALLREGGADVRVVNAGVPGHSTAAALGRLYFQVLPRARPAVVVIAHDVEDALAIAAPGFRSDEGHLRKPFRAEEPRGLRRWLERPGYEGEDLLGVGAPLRSLRPSSVPYDAGGLARAAGPWAMERNLRTMVDLAQAAGCRVVLLRGATGVTAPAVKRAVEAWNVAVDSVARATGASVADSATGSDPKSHFLAGGWLPSAVGHAHRAAVLAGVVR